MKRVSFLQQRSHSCGDISPTEAEAGWIDEDELDGHHHHHHRHRRDYDDDDDDDDDDNDDDDEFHVVRDRSKCQEGSRSRDETIEQRRQNWLRRKQRSKSSDFSWRSGMWSPVEDSNRVLIIVPSPKRTKTYLGEAQHKNKFKLPAFFQMDSGSSYESYDTNEAAGTGERPVSGVVEITPGVQKRQQQQQRVYPADFSAPHFSRPKHTSSLLSSSSAPPAAVAPNHCLRECGLVDRMNYLNVSKPTVSHLSPVLSSRSNRAWTQNQPKSHSLDSSFDDSRDAPAIHSTSSWRSSKHVTKSSHDGFAERQMIASESHEMAGTSPSHLFYTYNQSSRAMERKSFKGAEFLSRQTSERIRAGSEEIKHLRMKSRSPEVKRSEVVDTRQATSSGKHLSPHQWTAKGSGMDKRTTFSQQKSFSYDIPSPQPKQIIECRKKSEPIVGSSHRAPAPRARLFPGNQIFSVDRGGPRPQTRIDLQNLKSLSKPQKPPPPQEAAVEIFVTATGETASPDVGLGTKRHHYCSQRSQSCETDNRNLLLIKRPSISDQFLTSSPKYGRRDYLTRHELQQFEIEVSELPRSVERNQPLASSRAAPLLNQKSQSCEIPYPASEMKKIPPQGKELRTLMGYPRLYRQLAKSDMGVEPIMEKDSSGSSKDAPDPPVPTNEKSDSVESHDQMSDNKEMTSKKNIDSGQIVRRDAEAQNQNSKSFARCQDDPPFASKAAREFHPQAGSKVDECEGASMKVTKSMSHASAKVPEGRLVSDGIVTWRRKLPEVDAAAAHEKFEKLVLRNRSWIEEKKLKFVLQQQQQQREEHRSETKRKFYGEQRSFSYESEHHRAVRGSPHVPRHEAQRHPTVTNRRHQLSDFKKKSYSLDDKIPSDADRPTAATMRSTTRDEGVYENVPREVLSPERTRAEPTPPTTPCHEGRDKKTKKKLALLHDMKVLNDNEDSHPPDDLERTGRLCRKRMTCRLSLGKLFSKLKPGKVKK